MRNIDFNDNTLLHSVLFNPQRLESILTYGILSKEKAEEENIPFSKNYFGYNGNNYISMTRPLYTDKYDICSSYNRYVLKGISLIVENQEFLYDKQNNYFNHNDEVYVEDEVKKENIKGIIIPEQYLDIDIKELPVIATESTSYVNLKRSSDVIVNYLKTYNYDVNKEEYNEVLRYMYLNFEAYKSDNDESTLPDLEESKEDLSAFISNEVSKCFRKILNKDSACIKDIVNYINNKTLSLPINILETQKQKHKY